MPIHLAGGDRGSEADEDFVEVLGESEDGGPKMAVTGMKIEVPEISRQKRLK